MNKLNKRTLSKSEMVGTPGGVVFLIALVVKACKEGDKSYENGYENGWAYGKGETTWQEQCGQEVLDAYNESRK